VVEAYDDGTLGIKLLDGEPRDELNIFEGTQLNFANGATVEITENITISTVEGTTVAASLLEGGDLPTGEIAILPTAQMPGTQPVITSLVNLFHGNLYVQVHTNENPEPGDIRGQILPVRTVEDAEDGVLHGSTSNELFELNAADVGGLEIQEVAGRETLTLEGMETSMSDLHREDTDLIIDVNQDGSFQAADDLTLKDFFAEEAGEVGVGYIELVDEISGSEILTKISSSSNDLLKGTSGNDIKQGKGGNDIIFGFAGDDELYGNRGNDILKGGDGDDILKGGYENDTLKGNSGNDTLIGWLGFDALLGGSGEDSLSGGIGRDRLNGGEDDDILSGGASKDKFIFAANKTFSEANLGVDEITDFVSGKDRILLDVTVFTAIATTPGESLDSSEFAVVDGEADVFTADATIVYDSANSTLYYNPNGIENGLGDGDRFAIFSNGVSLEADDFLVRA
ncbi:MAG: CHRD domain-containing protein, partial [Okeania sp. SIO1H6]|nr:CHRD domain-containing protein [Okeania sp. SIO1H6]